MNKCYFVYYDERLRGLAQSIGEAIGWATDLLLSGHKEVRIEVKE